MGHPVYDCSNKKAVPNDLEELVSIFRVEELQIRIKHWEQPTSFHDSMSMMIYILYADKTAPFIHCDSLIKTYFH
jgi:hypothetical protein